jgi:glycosyltransferase involved in cell wall biosynthesis/SAM-dependent methyltransferase
MLEHDTTTPDIETASDAYARRFSGSAGRFLLEVQADAVNHLLQDTPAVGRVLEIGGGHGQLTQLLLDLGFEVWVQGSSTVCSRRVHLLMARSEYRDRLHFVASSLWELPFPDTSFDLVLGIRLLAHVERWRELLAEMARVCKQRLLLDYPPTMSANAFERWMFRFKRDIEGNTRPYFCYSFRELSGALRALGFERLSVEKEFFVPMVVHRALARQGLSRALERGSRALGLTRLVGGPVLLLAQRPDAMARLRPSLAPGEPRATSRVLLVAPEPFFTPVGTPLNVLQMCRALPELGHPVELLTLPMGETVPLQGVAYQRVPRLPWPHRVPVGFSISKAVYDFLLALAIVRRLRAQRYLAVHAIEESALYAMPIARWFGTPGIMDLDSDLCYQLRTNRSRLARLLLAPARWLRRRALRQATCTLTVARTLSDLVRRESPGTPVFEVGDIPSEALLRAPDLGRVEALREEFGLGGRRLVIYTGNFDGRQGVELLVRAMPEITARCPEALLLLVGGEPRQVESMHRLAAARGVGASVRAIGKKPLEQMPEFMALADVLVSPRIEPLVTPFKVYAYMASGRPIVATDLPTHTDVLTPECAVLVPATPTGLADGILTVLADAALGQRLGRQARATVETKHGYATFKAKLGAVYAFALRESELRAQSADDPMRVTSAP